MKELRFAIIGYGKTGKIRYETLSAMAGCRVVWICEPDPQAIFPTSIPNTCQVGDIFRDKEVDAVVVAPPIISLKNYVIEGLRHGKHVFAEKPPGRNMVELQEMIDEEKQTPDLKLMFGFNHRHHESMLHSKKLIDSGEYGRILWLRGRYGKSVDADFFPAGVRRKILLAEGFF